MRFGEAIVGVPVTVSMLRMALNAVGIMSSGMPSKVAYRMEGKLDGPAFGSTRFNATGEIALPAATATPGATPPPTR